MNPLLFFPDKLTEGTKRVSVPMKTHFCSILLCFLILASSAFAEPLQSLILKPERHRPLYRCNMEGLTVISFTADGSTYLVDLVEL